MADNLGKHHPFRAGYPTCNHGLGATATCKKSLPTLILMRPGIPAISSMTPRCFLHPIRWMAFLVMVIASIASGVAQEAPHFDGANLPAPPQQSSPWSAPAESGLAQPAVDAITKLSEEGLPDPRGCAYHEIEVVTGSCWGDARVTKTHGWIIPSSDQQAFAICWNGLIYPVVSVGPPAHLDLDMLELLTRDQAQLDEERAHYDQVEQQREEDAKRQGQAYHPTAWPFRWNTTVVPEATNTAGDSMRPMKAALLLRLGEAQWAKKIWTQWFRVRLQASSRDPYLTLKQDWVWALFAPTCAAMTISP